MSGNILTLFQSHQKPFFQKPLIFCLVFNLNIIDIDILFKTLYLSKVTQSV